MFSGEGEMRDALVCKLSEYIEVGPLRYILWYFFLDAYYRTDELFELFALLEERVLEIIGEIYSKRGGESVNESEAKLDNWIMEILALISNDVLGVE